MIMMMVKREELLKIMTKHVSLTIKAEEDAELQPRENKGTRQRKS